MSAVACANTVPSIPSDRRGSTEVVRVRLLQIRGHPFPGHAHMLPTAATTLVGKGVCRRATGLFAPVGGGGGVSGGDTHSDGFCRLVERGMSENGVRVAGDVGKSSIYK